MASKSSISDRVLEAFFKELEGREGISPLLLSRLSALLSTGESLAAEDFVRLIRESMANDAKA